MEAGDLKPVLAALVLPPTGPLLLALRGLLRCAGAPPAPGGRARRHSGLPRYGS